MLALLFVEEGLGSDEGFGRAFFKDLIRGERLEDFGQLSEFGLVAFFLPLGAEDADFLEVLDAFGELIIHLTDTGKLDLLNSIKVK